MALSTNQHTHQSDSDPAIKEEQFKLQTDFLEKRLAELKAREIELEARAIRGKPERSQSDSVEEQKIALHLDHSRPELGSFGHQNETQEPEKTKEKTESEQTTPNKSYEAMQDAYEDQFDGLKTQVT
jgi:hypothetical protein